MTNDIELLKQMFPHLDKHDSLIKYYLEQHNYDLNLVASMLSDELLNTDDDNINNNNNNNNIEQERIVIKAVHTPSKHQTIRLSPLSLKDLCENYLNRINTALIKHYEREDSNLDDDMSPSALDSPVDSPPDKLFDTSIPTTSNQAIETTSDDMNLIPIKIDKFFMKNIFNLFADSNELFDETGTIRLWWLIIS